MSGIGHNNGPTMEPGLGFRKAAWKKARADLIPNLPIEILRRRVARCKELGLPYKTYASVRASTGRDVIGFLFSNNALRVLRDHDRISDDRIRKLAALEGVSLNALVHAPLSPEVLTGLAAADDLDLTAARAPHFAQAWQEIRRVVNAPLQGQKLPGDGVLVIGDTSHERLWCDAGKLAGYIQADSFFGPDGAK